LARFVVDESLPPQIAEALRSSGHDAFHAAELGLTGANDDTIYRAATSREAVALTLDLDFSDVRLFPGDASIVVFRFRRSLRRDQLVQLCLGLLERFMPQIEQLEGKIMILEPGRSRIRPRF